MGMKPKNKDHSNFYECCDLTKKYIYRMVDSSGSAWFGLFWNKNRSVHLFRPGAADFAPKQMS